MVVIWDLIYLMGLILGAPLLIYKMIVSDKYRRGIGQKLGLLPLLRKKGKRVWIHGVSVGEIIAAGSLVRAIQAEMPEVEILLTVTTNTAFAVARRNHPGLPVHYWPLDFSFVIRRAINRFAPDVVALMELELWPNFLTEAQRARVPVLLVNGRISSKSYYVYRRSRPFLARSFKTIGAFSVQTEAYARRLRKLRVDPSKIFVTGNLKYDAVAATVPADPAAQRERLGIAAGELVFTAGSTHPGEEEAVANAYLAARKTAGVPMRLIVVPRAPQRLQEVKRLLEAKGISTVFKSAISGPLEPETAIIVDTMGEMMKVYSASDIVFVGGSLIPHGGQNMLEPAACGKAVLWGPRTHNFTESVKLLLDAHGGLCVADAAALKRETVRLACDPAERARMGLAASEAIRTRLGATRRNLEILRELLKRSNPRKTSF